MNSRYYEDKKRGMINEIKFKAYMEDKLNRPIKKYKDQYAELDFRDGRNLLELKGRGITHNQFPTTIFGYNKLLKARRKSNQGYHIYFYFLFTDGLYRWKYKDDENDIVCISPVRRVDRGRIEVKEHAFINIKDLEFITNKFVSINNEERGSYRS
tara:strand:- start:411 stop:875 length:465 start_codon:yes stop_codon:yes gene_type:complete